MISLKEFEKRQNILQEKIHHTIALHDEKIIETNFIEERLLLREIVYNETKNVLHLTALIEFENNYLQEIHSCYPHFRGVNSYLNEGVIGSVADKIKNWWGSLDKAEKTDIYVDLGITASAPLGKALAAATGVPLFALTGPALATGGVFYYLNRMNNAWDEGHKFEATLHGISAYFTSFQIDPTIGNFLGAMFNVVKRVIFMPFKLIGKAVGVFAQGIGSVFSATMKELKDYFIRYSDEIMRVSQNLSQGSKARAALDKAKKEFSKLLQSNNELKIKLCETLGLKHNAKEIVNIVDDILVALGDQSKKSEIELLDGLLETFQNVGVASKEAIKAARDEIALLVGKEGNKKSGFRKIDDLFSALSKKLGEAQKKADDIIDDLLNTDLEIHGFAIDDVAAAFGLDPSKRKFGDRALDTRLADDEIANQYSIMSGKVQKLIKELESIRSAMGAKYDPIERKIVRGAKTPMLRPDRLSPSGKLQIPYKQTSGEKPGLMLSPVPSRAGRSPIRFPDAPAFDRPTGAVSAEDLSKFIDDKLLALKNLDGALDNAYTKVGGKIDTLKSKADAALDALENTTREAQEEFARAVKTEFVQYRDTLIDTLTDPQELKRFKRELYDELGAHTEYIISDVAEETGDVLRVKFKPKDAADELRKNRSASKGGKRYAQIEEERVAALSELQKQKDALKDPMLKLRQVQEEIIVKLNVPKDLTADKINSVLERMKKTPGLGDEAIAKIDALEIDLKGYVDAREADPTIAAKRLQKIRTKVTKIKKDHIIYRYDNKELSHAQFQKAFDKQSSAIAAIDTEIKNFIDKDAYLKQLEAEISTELDLDEFIITMLNTKGITLTDVVNELPIVKEKKIKLATLESSFTEKLGLVTGDKFKFVKDFATAFDSKMTQVHNFLINSVLLGSSYDEAFKANKPLQRLVERTFYKLLFGKYDYLREKLGIDVDQYYEKILNAAHEQITDIDEEIGDRIAEQETMYAFAQQLVHDR